MRARRLVPLGAALALLAFVVFRFAPFGGEGGTALERGASEERTDADAGTLSPPDADSAEPDDGAPAARADDAETDEREALAAEARRGEEPELASEVEVLHLRVIDDETELAVAEAAVESRRGRSLGATDLDGRFAHAHDDDALETLVVRRDGYGTAHVQVAGRSRPAEDPLVLRLARAATLVGRVEGIDEVAPCLLVASTSSYWLARPSFVAGGWARTVDWAAPLDEDGGFDLGGLPPHAPLEFELRCAGERRIRLAVPPVELAPGERREVAWEHSGGWTIAGVVVDEAGAPVAGVPVAIELGRMPEGFGRLGQDVLGEARSDDAGRFRFDDAAAGAYLVGIAYEDRPVRPGAEPTAPQVAERWAARVAEVVVDGESAPEEVRLTAHRGLTLDGTVTESDGTPARGALVFVHRTGHPSRNALTDAEGRFELGPLARGAYTLRISPPRGATSAAPPPRTVEVPSPPLELALDPGGRIAGRIVDAETGAVLDGDVRPFAEDTRLPAYPMRDGAFAIGGLEPGTWGLIARADDGRIGRVDGLVLEEGASIEGVEIPVRSSARITCRYDGDEEEPILRVVQDGCVLLFEYAKPGRVYECRALPGPARVELLRWELRPGGSVQVPLRSRPVTARAGETTDARFE